MKLQELTDLLDLIEKTNEEIDLISIIIYSDGSGKISRYGKNSDDKLLFDSLENALEILHNIATPVEKEKNQKVRAKELVDSYSSLVPIQFGALSKDFAKQCAITHVDIILELIENNDDLNNQQYFIDANYWEKVKREIYKL